MKKLDENEVKKRGVCIQGDVVIFKADGTPEGEVDPKGILAEGEVTGHAHRVKNKHAVVLTNPEALFKWIKALDNRSEEEIEVEHEEHKIITLPHENHISWRQKEHNWIIGLRRTAD